MKNSRRFLALMLAFLLAFGNLSTVAMAAEGEGAGIQQTEPVSAEAPAPEAPPADAGTEAVPTEPVLEQAPAEPAQNAQPAEETQPSETPAEVPAEASSPEEAPASGAADAEMNEYSSAEAAPETEQPAAEPGVDGFKLPGVEVPEAPETEIVAPEPQADPSTNADNGIMPIYDISPVLNVSVPDTGSHEVGDTITIICTIKNERVTPAKKLGVYFSGLNMDFMTLEGIPELLLGAVSSLGRRVLPEGEWAGITTKIMILALRLERRSRSPSITSSKRTMRERFGFPLTQNMAVALVMMPVPV